MNHLLRLVPSLVAGLLLAGAAAAADSPGYLGETTCRVAPVEPRPLNDFVEWSGPCKDGFAEGQGKLSWRSWKEGKHTIEGKLVRGEISGEAKLTDKVGVYTGTLRKGVPHGQGYFEFADERGWYEGEVVNGLREGYGIQLNIDRSRYDGQWKNDAEHGKGRTTFAAGGSYDGEWKNGRFDGKGVIVYAGSGHKYEGQFADGRVAGSAAPEIVKGQFNMPSEHASARSRIRQPDATAAWPMNANWASLTAPQKNYVKAAYRALEEGDEPPYPLNGTRELVQAVTKIVDEFGPVKGALRLYVVVGVDGRAKSVKAIGSPNPQVTRLVSTVAGVQQYKPAVCRGQLCEMIYHIQISFGLE